MSKRPRTAAPKSSEWKKKKVVKKDPLDRWALEPGFKMNRKRTDTQVSTYFVTNTSATANLCSIIAQGTGDNARSGQRVRWESWTVKGFISFYPAATGIVQGDYLRCIFVYDRQTNAAAPLWKDLIYDDNTGLSLALGNANWYQRGRFKIIRDFKVPVPAMSATVAAALITAAQNLGTPMPTSSEMKIEFYKNFKGKIDCIYNGTGAGVNQINGGALWCFVQNLQGSNWWNLDIESSIEYTDV